MKPDEMSEGMLLYAYSKCLKKIEADYREKKELEAEIAGRNDILELKFQRGQIKLEREDEE